MVDDATLLGAALLGALVLYALFGGADFGGGVWYLFARGTRVREQRELVVHAIGPIWEANHVWLILVVVILFTGFPPAFAEIATHLHAPLLALLLAIVARGAAFAFHSASGDRPVAQRGWGATFAFASLAAPLLLGMIVGTLAAGDAAPIALALSWRGPWLAAFPIATGLFALVLFAFLAAVYLCLDANAQAALQEDFRRRALITGVLAGALALILFLLARHAAPLVYAGLSRRAWSLPLQLVTGVSAIVALTALFTRRFALARIAAATQVAFVVLGWGASQYPFLIPPALTLASASAPLATQRFLLYALVAGAVVLFPSLRLLLRIFKQRPSGP